MIFKGNIALLARFETFWKRAPAFFLALIMLFASYLALCFHPMMLIAFALFCIVAYQRWRLILVLGISTYLFVIFLYPHHSFQNEKGRALCTIHELQTVPTHYGKKQRAIVTMDLFSSNKQTLFDNKAYFYCRDLSSLSSNRLIARGNLVQFAPHTYLFKAEKIQPLKAKHSLMKKRQDLKCKLRTKIEKGMSHALSCDLIYALLSGEVNNMQLRMLFNRLGLSHLLAISGFHFSLLMALLGLCFFKSQKRLPLLCLIAAATLYFAFVGGFASIQRAYLMLIIVLIGECFKYKSLSINTLGVGLIVFTLFDPPLLLHRGFQLSFLATASLLLFGRSVNEYLKKILPTRTPFEVIQLNPISRGGYILLALVRKGFAVNIGVTLLCIPYILSTFKTFPLLSIYYNLFVPIVIALLMALALIALLIPPIFLIVNGLCEFLLLSLELFPKALDITIKWEGTSSFLNFSIIILLLLGIYAYEMENERRRDLIAIF